LSDQIRYDLHIIHDSLGASTGSDTTIHNDLVKNIHIDTLDIGRYEWKVKAKDNWGAETWSEQTWGFVYFIRGDVNGDGIINSADIVYLINYLFKDGPEPDPLWAGDCNCDGVINSADVVYLINYLFKGGPPPCSKRTKKYSVFKDPAESLTQRFGCIVFPKGYPTFLVVSGLRS